MHIDLIPGRIRTLAAFLAEATHTVFGNQPAPVAPPVPESTKALTRSRPFIGDRPESPFPLRGSDGVTYAERRANRT